mgnify:CR=1 FL=1
MKTNKHYRVGQLVHVVKPEEGDLMLDILGWISEGDQFGKYPSMDSMLQTAQTIIKIELLTLKTGPTYIYHIGPYKFAENWLLPASSLSTFLNGIGDDFSE